MQTYKQEHIFTFDHAGQKYRIERATGDVHVWISRTQKASGWQRIKSVRRIKAVTRTAVKAFAAELNASDERITAAIFKAPSPEAR